MKPKVPKGRRTKHETRNTEHCRYLDLTPSPEPYNVSKSWCIPETLQGFLDGTIPVALAHTIP